MLSWCWSVLYPAHKFWRKSGQNGPKCNILWINHDKYPPNCLKNCQEQDSSHFFFNHSSVVVELDVAVRLVLVEVAVEVSHTSDFYGRYLFWGEDLHEKNWAKNVLVRWGCRVFRNCCSLWRQRRATSGLNNWWMENEVQGPTNWTNNIPALTPEFKTKDIPGSKEDDIWKPEWQTGKVVSLYNSTCSTFTREMPMYCKMHLFDILDTQSHLILAIPW